MAWELQFVTMTENQIDKKIVQYLGNHNIYGKGKTNKLSVTENCASLMC